MPRQPRRQKNSTGYRGVCRLNGYFPSYTAKFTHNCIKFYLGCFDNEIEAAKAYDAKAVEILGDKAITNFPQEN